MTSGVDVEVGAKPGIPLFLFLFRLFRSFSALFPAPLDAILVSEAAGNKICGFVHRIVRKSRQM